MLTPYPTIIVLCLMKYKSWISTSSLLKWHTNCLLLWALSCCTYTIYQELIKFTKFGGGKQVIHAFSLLCK